LIEADCEPDDERWMLLDTDHCIKGSHLPTFSQAIQDAKEHNIKVAISRSCFEVWLLLHHVDDLEVIKNLSNAPSVEKELRKIIGGYNKTRLKIKHYPLTLVVAACQRAARLDETVGSGDIPEGNTSRVYLLWKAIVAKMLPSLVPVELKPLLNL
jgi:RloB-like protein